MANPMRPSDVERLKALEKAYRDLAKGYGSLANADEPRADADALAAAIGLFMVAGQASAAWAAWEDSPDLAPSVELIEAMNALSTAARGGTT
jgi:hypothetical protein